MKEIISYFRNPWAGKGLEIMKVRQATIEDFEEYGEVYVYEKVLHSGRALTKICKI